MKKCAYCGRENEEEVTHCRECGTEFQEPSPAAEPVEGGGQPEPEWLGGSLRWIGTTLLVVIIYLLSFGPVCRYSGTVVNRTTTSTTQMCVVVRTVRYPAWVGVAYYPAFMMSAASGPNGLYGRYLTWCQKPPGE